MHPRLCRPGLVLAGCFLLCSSLGAAGLEEGFRHPPADARPWVYWFWLNGNISSNGITADLEAMKRVGVGGVLIMEVDQGAPVGPVDFMSERWRALFGHVHREAQRLGLEVNMNNDAGWNGSGGPWIRPEQAMQEVVWSETEVEGPTKFNDVLAEPPKVAGYYRDIEVQAFPTVGGERIANIDTKAQFQRKDLHKPGTPAAGLPNIIDLRTVTNLTARLETNGRLVWDVPAGRWTILRLGHTCTGLENAPAPASGRGLECDKLSRAGIEANFAGMMQKLALDNGLNGTIGRAGLVATHIDSWENGVQNWSTVLPAEFRQRRGYALTPYLPVLTGRVMTSPEVSERFLWDLRQTISELVIENYAGRMRELAHGAGMRFTVEAYGSPCDAIPYAGQSDEPMGEFWTPSGALETCKAMASAAHIYGKTIVGAEACTSGDRERWLEHPALLKPHVDRAFCEGINRMVFHRYAMQPWPGKRAPGMTMGPWGQHYERTQTWWQWTPGWHEYLARCQYLLRQGHFVADLCYVVPEAPPQGPGVHRRDGADWDECTAEAVVTRMTVKHGRITLPDGMSYRGLVLPWSQTMTPRLLAKVRDLAMDGAIVFGPKPTASPSLQNYPGCDEEVRQTAAALWGNADGQKTIEHPCGKGWVVWTDAPDRWLRDHQVPADFASGQPLRFLHRRTAKADIYFVANLENWAFTTTCSFRVAGKVPELWWPETGRCEAAAVWQNEGPVTHVSIPFESAGSVFVVFREAAGKTDPIVEVRRDGQTVLTARPEPRAKVVVNEARYGLLGDPARTRDVKQRVQQQVDTGELVLPVSRLVGEGDPAPLKVKELEIAYTIQGRNFQVKARDGENVQISADALRARVMKARYGVLDDPKRTRDMRERVQRWLDAGLTSFKVADLAQGDDPAFLVVKTVELELEREGKTEKFTGQDPDTIQLVPMMAPKPAVAAARRGVGQRSQLQFLAPGEFEWRTLAGKMGRAANPAAGQSMEIAGPWTLSFAPGRGAPASVNMPSLVSWSELPEAGARYFSGEASYRTRFSADAAFVKSKQSVMLDLGRVEVMARVHLNGKELGVLWKPPYQVEVGQSLRAGENTLKVTVVNLWPNRLIGDEQLAEDSDRNPDGTLKKWPDWLQRDQPSPAGRVAFTSWRLWRKDEPLRPSGLLGPVRLIKRGGVSVP